MAEAKNCIYSSVSPGEIPDMKKAAHTGGSYLPLGQLVPRFLYKGVWIVEIVIVEDVLVLVCERLVRHIHFVYFFVVLRRKWRYNLTNIK